MLLLERRPRLAHIRRLVATRPRALVLLAPLDAPIGLPGVCKNAAYAASRTPAGRGVELRSKTCKLSATIGCARGTDGVAAERPSPGWAGRGSGPGRETSAGP